MSLRTQRVKYNMCILCMYHLYVYSNNPVIRGFQFCVYLNNTDSDENSYTWILCLCVFKLHRQG